MKTGAIVLAAGSGTRMQAGVPKQYMEIKGRPLIYYALRAFEDSPVDDVVLVTGKEDIAYCKDEIVDRYGFDKVDAVVAGGKERYHSVYAGLCAAEGLDYVLIHDGARPCIEPLQIEKLLEEVKHYKACVAAVRVKDTIKIADEEGSVKETPKRSCLWQVQTPQAFEYTLIREAYNRLFAMEHTNLEVTDDAMVVEQMLGKKIWLVENSYKNIKVTTPDDKIIAEAFLEK